MVSGVIVPALPGRRLIASSSVVLSHQTPIGWKLKPPLNVAPARSLSECAVTSVASTSSTVWATHWPAPMTLSTPSAGVGLRTTEANHTSTEERQQIMTNTPEQQPDNLIGSLANKQAASGSGSSMCQWLIVGGVVTAIIGVIAMVVAYNRKEHAEDANELAVALGGYASYSDMQSAITLGHIGLGLLIAGGLLALAGLVVVALCR